MYKMKSQDAIDNSGIQTYIQIYAIDKYITTSEINIVMPTWYYVASHKIWMRLDFSYSWMLFLSNFQVLW